MAIVTPIGTGNVNFSDVNGFYRVEAANFFLGGSVLSLSSARQIPVTFANAGNLLGVFIGIIPGGNKNITVKLQQNTGSWVDVAGCTVTKTVAEINNNAVTRPGGGLYVYKFVFGTPAAVTTAANTWRLDVSNATGTTDSSIATSDATNAFYAAYCDNLVSFTNNDAMIVGGPNTVTLDGNYRLNGVLGTGVTTTATALILGSSNTNYTSANAGNFLVDTSASRTLTIDGVSVAVSAGGFRVGSSASRVSYANQFIIDYVSPTLGTQMGHRQNVSGNLAMRSSYFFYGEAPTQQTTLAYDAALGGTITMSIADPCVVTRSAHTLRNGTPVKFSTSGTLPTGITAGTIYWTYSTGANTFNLYDTYANAIAGGTTGRVATSGSQSGTHTLNTVVITTDSTGWSVGDSVYFGGVPEIGGIDTTTRTISAISGTEISLSSNFTKNRYSDGAVVRTNRYGIKIQGTNSSNSMFQLGAASNLVLSGIEFYGIFCYAGHTAANTNNADDSANRSDWIIEDCSSFRASGGTHFFLYFGLPPNDTYIRRVNVVNANLLSNLTSTTSDTQFSYGIRSGRLFIDDCWHVQNSTTAFSAIGQAPSTTAITMEIDGCRWENGASGSSLVTVGFVNTIIRNCKFWGQSTSSGTYGALNIFTSIGMLLENNTYNFCSTAHAFQATPTINMISLNESFGTIGANTQTIYENTPAYIDVKYKSPTGTLTEPSGLRPLIVSGSKIAITDENDVATVDRLLKREGNLVRCGTGLSDTTVYSTDSYSYRAENTNGSSSERLEWIHKNTRPIGNQQNKDLFVICWVRIAKEAYWAGTHEMPRLYVDYDDGTEVYAEAAQIASDTVGVTTDGWQKLTVPFTPTTTYGEISIKCTCLTDASTVTDRYVYWGRFSVLDGAGETVNTGLLGVWADAEPLTPIIATVPPPADVAEATWLADPSTFSAGTVGALVNSIKAKINGILGLVTTLLR